MLPPVLAFVLALGLATGPAPAQGDVGTSAPPLQAARWLNQVGQTPTWSALRGKVVLIEFWATW